MLVNCRADVWIHYQDVEEKIALVLEKQISRERLLNILLMRCNLEIENNGREFLLKKAM